MKYTMGEIWANRDWWVRQLESGDFEQGKDTLVHETSDGKRFCCLGIPAWVQFKSGNIFGCLRKDRDDDYYFSDEVIDSAKESWYLENASKTYMPASVAGALGLNMESQELLMHLNDSGVSFKIIAGVIRKLPIEFTEADKKISFQEES